MVMCLISILCTSLTLQAKIYSSTEVCTLLSALLYFVDVFYVHIVERLKLTVCSCGWTRTCRFRLSVLCVCVLTRASLFVMVFVCCLVVNTSAVDYLERRCWMFGTLKVVSRLSSLEFITLWFDWQVQVEEEKQREAYSFRAQPATVLQELPFEPQRGTKSPIS